MIRTRLHCDLPGALLNFTNLETFEDWKKSPSFLEVALYVKSHSLIGRSKKLKNFIEVAAYQRSFTVFWTMSIQPRPDVEGIQVLQD